MADFAEWIVACERGLGWEAGAFLAAFEENRDESKASLIENDMFSTALVSMVKAAPQRGGPRDHLLPPPHRDGEAVRD